MERRSSPRNNPNDKVDIIIHVIRHAESEANILPRGAPKIFNAPLSPHGEKQCRHVLATFPHMSSITYMLVSPMRRTLQTAFLSFPPLFTRGLKAILVGELKEFGCRGTPREILLDEFADRPVDFRALAPEWHVVRDHRPAEKAKRVEGTKMALAEFANCVWEGGEWRGIPIPRATGRVEILLVSHGGLLAGLGCTDGGDFLYNAQFKSFRFADVGDVGFRKYDLVETEESQARRHVRVRRFVNPDLNDLPVGDELEGNEKKA